jgi:hypothetical protein
VDVQFQMGDSVFLINPTKEAVIATRLISRIGGQACVHHGITIEAGWFQVQLSEVMESSSNIPLLVTNEDDDPPQLKLQDVVGSSLVWKGQFLQKTK